MTRTQTTLITIFVLGGFLLCLAYAIVSSEKTVKKTGVSEKVAPAPKPRIIPITSDNGVYIYEIDSVEYIISSYGGIYPLNKKSK